MSNILKVFTPEQLYDMMEKKIIADNVGLVNFNEGSRIRAILEAVAKIEATTGLDYIEALRQSIPIALYDGFGFKKKDGVASSGYFRFYRIPSFTIEYTGSGTAVSLTVTDTDFTTTVTGAAGDNISADFTTYPDLDSLVTYIDGLANWSATLIKDETSDCSDLYNYSGKEIYSGSKNYLNNDGADIFLDTAVEAIVSVGNIIEIDDVNFILTGDGTLSAGDSSITLAARCVDAGSIGNLSARGVDTFNGKGSLSTPINNIEHVINDSAFSGGTNEETDAERASRFQIYVQGLAGSTPLGMQAAVLGITGIKSCTIREKYPQAGINTIVADDGTGNLSSDLIDQIEKVIDGDPDDIINYPGKRAAGITVNITPPTIVPVDVVITVFRVGTGSDSDEITDAVQTVIENYINTQKLGQDIVVNEIIALAKKSHSAIYDVNVTTPAANVSIDDTSLGRTGSGTGASVSVTLSTYSQTP